MLAFFVSFGSSLLVSKTVQSGKIIHNRCNFHFDSPEISVGEFSNEAKASFIKVKTFDRNKLHLWYEKVTQHNCMEFQFFTDLFFVITRHVKMLLWGGSPASEMHCETNQQLLCSIRGLLLFKDWIFKLHFLNFRTGKMESCHREAHGNLKSQHPKSWTF